MLSIDQAECRLDKDGSATHLKHLRYVSCWNLSECVAAALRQTCRWQRVPSHSDSQFDRLDSLSEGPDDIPDQQGPADAGRARLSVAQRGG